MKISQILESILDVIEVVIRWGLIWFLIISTLVTISLLIDQYSVYKSNYPAYFIILLGGPIVLISLFDLVLRLRGKNNLINIIYESKASEKVSIFVEKGERVASSVLQQVVKVISLILIYIIYIAIIFIIYNGIAAMPLNLAIIIGAAIIAYSLHKNRN